MDRETVNILLVDDLLSNLLALEAVIEQDRYRLHRATSGEEALKLLMKYDFAVILLDVQMPGMDGFETAKIIKAREKTREIPILFITANQMKDEHMFAGYSVGAVDYILKPVDPFILKAKVDVFVQLYEMKRKLQRQAEMLARRNEELQQAYQTIRRMAYSDWLTRVPNRRSFRERIHEVCAEARRNNQPFALLHVDLDRFKHVNDTLGPAIGDELLVQVARRLASCLREDDFIARIGGDEFQIIMPNTGRETALEHAEQIMEAFSKPFDLDHFELYVTTSIGISVFPYDGEDVRTILKHADAALSRAKEKGKNQYRIFHSGMNMITYRSFILQNDLHRALERGELALVYQPRIDLNTGEVTSAEALLTWNHPQWGTILPSEFIPLAETSGMMSEIGEWTIREVCRQNREWTRSGLTPIRIAVRFSSHQFLERNLVGKIRQIVLEHGLSPNLLEISVAETSVASDEEYIARTMGQFKQAGMALSLDEYGSGSCPIRYLWKFPVDSLVIDRFFVKNVPSNADNLSLLKAIVDLAHSRNISVIAKGIETEEQLAVLRELGCEEFQGFLFCPPLSPEDFADFLRKCRDNDMLLVRHKPPAFSFGSTQPPPVSPSPQSLQAALRQTKEAHSISRREFEVFELMIAGYSNKEISQKLYISEHTVKNHITRILQKLNVADRIQAMAKVYQACITETAASVPQTQQTKRGEQVK